MTRLPAMTYREVTRRLRSAGFVFDRQAKGSHEIWYNPQTRRRTTVPHHTIQAIYLVAPGAPSSASHFQVIF